MLWVILTSILVSVNLTNALFSVILLNVIMTDVIVLNVSQPWQLRNVKSEEVSKQK
jgi:hypothetical protein